MRLLSIIIPCYREAATISEVVERTVQAALPSGWEREVIVVDDGSDGETIEVLAELEDEESGAPVRIIYRSENGGKGAAVKDGLRAAQGDYCIIQDADLELNPDEISGLLAPIDEGRARTVFGYRVSEGVGKERNSYLFYGGRLISLCYNLCFGTQFKDIPCCYKVFPHADIPALLETPSIDFVFDAVEMTRVLDQGGKVAQLPVSYHPRSRAQGKKIRWQHGAYCFIAIVLLRLNLHRAPLSREVPKVLRFLASGLMSVAANLILLWLLVHLGHAWYLLASALAFLGSWAANFSLHKFWTFNYTHAKSMRTQLPMHFLLGLINLFLNTALVWGMVEYLGLWYVLAQLIAAGIVAVESFALISRIIFREA